MRLDVNLATHPYEDTRQFWIRWGSAGALIASLTGALLYSAVTEWSFAEKDRGIMSQYKTQIANRDQERSRAEAVLNRPENRTTRDRSQFLNQLIERKAFSWTQVFADLERMMPEIGRASCRERVESWGGVVFKQKTAYEIHS